MSNSHCAVLGIEVPTLGTVARHREANTYARLLVVLLEKGEPMTLSEIAARFEEAGLGSAEEALRSLQRCRPARSAVFRDGDLYTLDPHDHELDLWVLRLGLRPPKTPNIKLVPPIPEPLPGPEVPLSKKELATAFTDPDLPNWSAQRVALAVLDAHGGRLDGAEVVRIADSLSLRHRLREESAHYWRRGAPIQVSDHGEWVVDPHHRALASARDVAHEHVEHARRNQHRRTLPAEVAVMNRRWQKEQAANAEELARLRRALVHAHPPSEPRALVLLDIAKRELLTYADEELDEARQRLADCDFIAAVEVRPLLRALAFEAGTTRLAELGQAQ